MDWRANLPAATKQFLTERAEAIRATARDAAYEIGKHLVEVRERCPHGEWLPWLDNEFGWSHTQADNYMNIYRAIEGGNLNHGLQFGLSVSSLALLARPSTPDEARAEVTDLVDAGEKPTRDRVKGIIEEHKPDKPSVNLPENVDLKYKRAERAARAAPSPPPDPEPDLDPAEAPMGYGDDEPLPPLVLGATLEFSVSDPMPDVARLLVTHLTRDQAQELVTQMQKLLANWEELLEEVVGGRS